MLLLILDFIEAWAANFLCRQADSRIKDCSNIKHKGGIGMADKDKVIDKDSMPLCEAANYFKEEILEIMPDIATDQLADMVSLYIYYQYGITKEEAKKIIEKTCL